MTEDKEVLSVTLLEELIQLAQKYHLKSLSFLGIQFELFPFVPPLPPLEESAKALSKEEMPPDHEMLMFSTDTFMASTDKRDEQQIQIDKEIENLLKG